MSRVAVKSPVAGTISLVLVESGTQVVADEDLGEVELMKTMFRITAPVAGTVRWLHGPGEIVAEDETIAEITT